MSRLKINKATYYNPNIGNHGPDVTAALGNFLKGDLLYFDGAYNHAFGDPFPSVQKRLEIQLEYDRKKHTKVYIENERIDLPRDLGVAAFPQPEGLIAKFFWYGIVAVVAMVVGGLLVYTFTEGKLPAIFGPSSSISTTTPNVADIFYRLSKIDRPIDQRTFLNQFNGTKIYGVGTFSSLGGSKEESSYQLYVAVPTGWLSKEYIACMIRGADQSVSRQIDLYKTGQEIRFIGDFSNSIVFGSSAWTIDNCTPF